MSWRTVIISKKCKTRLSIGIYGGKAGADF